MNWLLAIAILVAGAIAAYRLVTWFAFRWLGNPGEPEPITFAGGGW